MFLILTPETIFLSSDICPLPIRHALCPLPFALTFHFRIPSSEFRHPPFTFDPLPSTLYTLTPETIFLSSVI
jgi:hypothetical protein